MNRNMCRPSCLQFGFRSYSAHAPAPQTQILMRAPPPYPAFNVVSSAAFKPEKNLTVNHIINIEWEGRGG